jgi:hypothetical protein
MAAALEPRLLKAQTARLPPIDFLSALVCDELLRRQDRLLARRVQQAGFRDPDKRLDTFDFDFNKKMNRRLVRLTETALGNGLKRGYSSELPAMRKLRRVGASFPKEVDKWTGEERPRRRPGSSRRRGRIELPAGQTCSFSAWRVRRTSIPIPVSAVPDSNSEPGSGPTSHASPTTTIRATTGNALICGIPFRAQDLGVERPANY